MSNTENITNEEIQVQGQETEIKTETATETTVNKETLRAEIEAEIKAETQREMDRRITEAIKKREKQLKAEADERERLAKLSEEEKLAELKSENERKQREKEVLLNSRELKLEMIDYLNEKSCDLSLKEMINIDNIAELEDAELRKSTLKSQIDKTIEIFNKAVDKRVEELKAELLKGTTPAISNTTKPMSDYDKAVKNRDVKSMLLAKFN